LVGYNLFSQIYAMLDTTITPYEPKHRSAVFRIAADTAFFGDPVEAYLDDRRLFCDIFYRYYTDIENQHSWVSIREQVVIGFLMSSVDTAAQKRRWATRILPSTLGQVLKGNYRFGKKTWSYAVSMLRAAINQEYVSCNLEEYPAHLHINIDEKGRGYGIGRKLMETCLDHLQSAGIPGVHLHTTNLNQAASSLYTRLGFELLDRRKTSLWRTIIDQPVENRCYGIRFV
jgi:ribosomal protein S18 acetylase RimI-like enzyme